MRPLRHLLFATSALVPLGLVPASANPLGAQVVGGSATVQGQGTAAVTVTQSSDKAIINWNTFNIGNGETTRFIQPSASSVALNRITGGLGPSQIFGTLSANGRVFLVNPDGILFGPNSKVDTAGFLATTHDIKNSDFMAGRYNFTLPGRPDASIVNQGTITAQTGGFAALVAPGVRNSGTITARLGSIGLGASNGFMLDFYGDKLITLGVGDAIATQVKDVATGQTLDALVKNEGKLKANGGRVELTAVAARQVVDAVINNTGRIEANSVGQQNGMVVLGAETAGIKPADAPTQTVRLSGSISASGKRKGTSGGAIQVTGESIAVAAAKLDASGQAGGGKVLIGGDTGGGKGNAVVASIAQARLETRAVPTATTVTVDAATTINASARNSGDGGKVVVWSDQATAFLGTVLVRGGRFAGDGGFVEVSSHQQLAFDGKTELGAPAGTGGALLLDPRNVTISAGATARGGFGGVLGGFGFVPNGDDSVLNVSALVSNLSGTGGTLFVTTGTTGGQLGNITVATPISWSGGKTLTLVAANSIFLNAAITAPAGGLTLNAGNAIAANSAITVDKFTLQSGFWSQVATNLPSFSATDFRISGGTFLRSLAGDGAIGSPYQITDLFGLQGLGSSGMLDKSFVLANDLAASATRNWNSGSGFSPIGTTASPFLGTLDGKTFVVVQLLINSGATNVGLFGHVGAAGTVRNVGLTNATVLGGDGSTVGGLAGYNLGSISQAYVTGFVGGGFGSTIGGLVGKNAGSISQAYSTAAVGSAPGSVVGGLVGESAGGTITQSYATGLALGGVDASLASSIPTISNTYASAVSGNNLYIADTGAGFHIYDISNPNSPLLKGSVGLSGAMSVAVKENYAYVGDAVLGLVIIDIGNPSAPAIISSIPAGTSRGIALSGNFAFVSDDAGGKVRAFDVSNPLAPSLVGTSALGGNPVGLAVQGSYLYVANQANGRLQIVDISNPAAPVFVGHFTGGTNPTGLRVSGNYAYVADAGKGLLIVDISNPLSPSLVSSFDTTAHSNNLAAYFDVSVRGSYAYIADRVSKFKIVDISNPAFPHLAGILTTPFGGTSITIAGDYAYFANDAQGLKIIDIGSSGSTLGGLVGAKTGGTVTSSYWDTQTSGQNTSAAGAARNTSQLTGGLQLGFDPSAWAISNSVNSGYPFLQASTPVAPPVTPTPAPTTDPMFAATLASLTNQSANVSKSDTSPQNAGNKSLISNSVLPLITTNTVPAVSGPTTPVVAPSLSTEKTKEIASSLPSESTSARLPEWQGFSMKNPETLGKDSANGKGYCTDYIRNTFSENKIELPFSGHAETWFGQAQGNPNFQTIDASQISKVPAGAIAVWDGGGYGHVAIVKSNDGKGLIVFAEANWGSAKAKDDLTVPQATRDYYRAEVITERFNKVDLNSRSYGAAKSRSGGEYTLLGFIIPK